MIWLFKTFKFYCNGSNFDKTKSQCFSHSWKCIYCFFSCFTATFLNACVLKKSKNSYFGQCVVVLFIFSLHNYSNNNYNRTSDSQSVISEFKLELKGQIQVYRGLNWGLKRFKMSSFELKLALKLVAVRLWTKPWWFNPGLILILLCGRRSIEKAAVSIQKHNYNTRHIKRPLSS